MELSSTGLSRTWQRRLAGVRAWAHRAGAVFVVAGALVGFAAGVKVFVLPQHPDEADVTATAFRAANQRDAAGQFAANFVAAVLTTPASARPAALQRFITLPKSEAAAASTAPASDPAPAVIDTPKVWSVIPNGAVGEATLFSVMVMVQQRPYASAPATLAFYRVPVSIWRFQPRAMDMPVPVGDPGLGADLMVSYDYPLSPSSPVYAVVAGFVNSYLTSTASLDRYVVAGSWIRPVGGYQSAAVTGAATNVEVPDPGAGAQIRVRVTVKAQTSQFATVPFTFPLTLENSGGTWMVADLDLNPQVVSTSDAVPAGRSQR